MKKTIAERLKEEREAKALNAEAFGAIGGVKRASQFGYENPESGRYPDAHYLSEVYKVGVDIKYIVTGERDNAQLSEDEAHLLNLYKQAPTALKMAAIAVLESKNQPTSPQNERSIDNVGQYIEGDVNDQTIHGGFNFGNKKE